MHVETAAARSVAVHAETAAARSVAVHVEAASARSVSVHVETAVWVQVWVTYAAMLPHKKYREL